MLSLKYSTISFHFADATHATLLGEYLSFLNNALEGICLGTVGRTKNTSKGFYKISFLYCKICAELLLQHILTMIMYLNVQFDWNSLDFV